MFKGWYSMFQLKEKTNIISTSGSKVNMKCEFYVYKRQLIDIKCNLYMLSNEFTGEECLSM